jgi:hypothetical protein
MSFPRYATASTSRWLLSRVRTLPDAALLHPGDPPDFQGRRLLFWVRGWSRPVKVLDAMTDKTKLSLV